MVCGSAAEGLFYFSENPDQRGTRAAINSSSSAPRRSFSAPRQPKTRSWVARARGNVFEALMDAVKVASLGQVSGALYDVGGEYRRNM